jgi:hypothetical protein
MNNNLNLLRLAAPEEPFGMRLKPLAISFREIFLSSYSKIWKKKEKNKVQLNLAFLVRRASKRKCTVSIVRSYLQGHSQT